jgi:hypothetical protein
MNEIPSSRREASQMGSFKFYTGKACKHGHLAYRYTKTGNCVQCMRMNQQRYTKELHANLSAGLGYIKVPAYPSDRKAVLAYAEALIAFRQEQLGGERPIDQPFPGLDK